MSIAGIPRELPRESATVTGTSEMLRQVRSYTGRRLIAHATGGVLKLYRYNDAVPDTIAQTITVASSGVTCCSLTQRGCGTLDLLYCQSAAVKWAVSRDEGATWTSAAVSVGGSAATGYSQVEHALWGGMLVTMLYQTAGSAWYCSVAQLGDSHTWVWPAAHLVGAAKRAPGTLRHLADGSWQFACVNVSDVPLIYTCKNLTPAGGTWTSSTNGSGYTQIAQHVAGGMLVQPAYDSSAWKVIAATRDSAGAWSYGSAQTLTTGKAASGSLIRGGQGQWEFAYVPTGATTPSIKRCKALKPDGTGTWS